MIAGLLLTACLFLLLIALFLVSFANINFL